MATKTAIAKAWRDQFTLLAREAFERDDAGALEEVFTLCDIMWGLPLEAWIEVIDVFARHGSTELLKSLAKKAAGVLTETWAEVDADRATEAA